MKYITAIILSTCFFFCFNKAHATEVYSANLYYDEAKKLLKFDSLKDNVTIKTDEEMTVLGFLQEEKKGPYSLVLYDENEAPLLETQFEAKTGSFSVELPYFSLAAKMKIFKKGKNEALLIADLSQYQTCNGNGICEPEKRENEQNCLGDCVLENDNINVQEEKKEGNADSQLSEGQDVLIQKDLKNETQTKQASLVKWLVFVSTGLIVLLSVLFMYFRRKGN